MRKVVSCLFAMVMFMGLAACTPPAKEFSGSGMTVTLNNQFVEKEVLQAQLYLESTQHIFMGSGENKSDAIAAGISDLKVYTERVIKNNKKDSTVEEFSEGDVRYFFAYYTSTVGSESFGYMLVCMEGATKYYSMNFGCREKNLEDNKAQYQTWAKTIKVE